MSGKTEVNFVRDAAVVGRFYPADADALRTAVRRYIAAAEPSADPPRTIPKAIIGPHAGYVYSGPIAGSAYAQLTEAAGNISRVVLIGPAHYVPVFGLAASGAEAFETPLGSVPVDREAVRRVLELPQVSVIDEAHAPEHSLEVHLPFLQELLGEFELVPLLVGETTPAEVAEVLDMLWGGPETLIVVSSDLSHFHDFETARSLDAETSRGIEELRTDGLRRDRACGARAIAGLLRLAKERGLRAKTLDLRNSGDTAGSRDRVVGYGAYAFV